MVWREVLWPALVMLVSVSGAFGAGVPPPARSSGGPAEPWLKLQYGGTQMSGPFGKGETLTVDDDGTVTVVLACPRGTGCIGVFERRLSPDEIQAWKDALTEFDLEQMRDFYPQGRFAGEGETWLDLSVRLGDRRKHIVAWASSMLYPRGLEMLFDINRQLPNSARGTPDGYLSEVIEDLLRHPKAAIGAAVEVPKREWQVGESIRAEVVITNIGVEPVVLPLPGKAAAATKAIGDGFIDVVLGDRAELTGEVVDGVFVSLGRPQASGEPGSAAQGLGAEQVKVVLPGEAWRIALPPLASTTKPGTYWLGGRCVLDPRWHAGLALVELGTPIAGQLPIKAAELRVVEK